MPEINERKFNPNSDTWLFTADYLRKERSMTLESIVGTSDPEVSARLKGRVQFIDELLNLPTNIL